MHGNGVRAAVGFNQGTAATFAEARMRTKIFQVIGTGNGRFVGRNDLLPIGYYHCAGYVFTELGVPRTTTRTTFGSYQCGTIRSDVSWTLFYFLLVKALLEANGATVVQAEYVACSAVIDVVGVAYGQTAGVNWGLSPEDFGFQVPPNLPAH